MKTAMKLVVYGIFCPMWFVVFYGRIHNHQWMMLVLDFSIFTYLMWSLHNDFRSHEKNKAKSDATKKLIEALDQHQVTWDDYFRNGLNLSDPKRVITQNRHRESVDALRAAIDKARKIHYEK